MGNTTGCFETFVAITIAIITGLISSFSTFVTSDSTYEQNQYPFVLADETVNYSLIETINCQFEIGGNVEFLDENTIDRENIVIKLQPLGTYDDRPNAIAYIGSDNSYGLIIPDNYWYSVWVHDLDSDLPLSEKILVDNLDCASGRIRATVNFRQILSLR